MLKPEIQEILTRSKEWGWVLEPDAKEILRLSGITVPRFVLAWDVEEAESFARQIGYPVVAKVVSPRVLHKTDSGGVLLGIRDRDALARAFRGFQKFDGFEGMLVEEMVSGKELILGGKVDHQFGPIVLLGLGGILAEIYQDTALRMAPIGPNDVVSMMNGLKAHKLFTGFRGSEPINLGELSKTLVTLSHLMMDLEDQVSSMDLNPVMCDARRCVVADARIMLKENGS